MPRVKNREMDKHFGIAYTPSENKMRITIPDTVVFPSTQACFWFKDKSTLVMAEDAAKTVKHHWKVMLTRKETVTGCREAIIGPISHGLGSHWRITDVTYSLVEGRFHLHLPKEEDRLPPLTRRRSGKKEKVVDLSVKHKGETSTVLIELNDKTMEFKVPADVIRALIGHWLVDGYYVKEDNS